MKSRIDVRASASFELSEAKIEMVADQLGMAVDRVLKSWSDD